MGRKTCFIGNIMLTDFKIYCYIGNRKEVWETKYFIKRSNFYPASKGVPKEGGSAHGI